MFAVDDALARQYDILVVHKIDRFSRRLIRMPAIMLFFISASEVTLWLEFYTTGGVFSIVCDEIADCLLEDKKVPLAIYLTILCLLVDHEPKLSVRYVADYR